MSIKEPVSLITASGCRAAMEQRVCPAGRLTNVLCWWRLRVRLTCESGNLLSNSCQFDSHGRGSAQRPCLLFDGNVSRAIPSSGDRNDLKRVVRVVQRVVYGLQRVMYGLQRAVKAARPPAAQTREPPTPKRTASASTDRERLRPKRPSRVLSRPPKSTAAYRPSASPCLP